MQIVKEGKIIESETGEVIDELSGVRDLILENRTDPIAELIARSGSVPIHVQKARELDIPASVVSTYIGNPAESANQHLNKRIEIIGAIVYFSGRFTPKDPKEHDGSGFYCFLLKTSETRQFEYRVGKEIHTTEVPVIIKTDGVKLRDTVISLIDTWGWYDWDVKVPVVFTRGGANNEFYIQVLPE